MASVGRGGHAVLVLAMTLVDFPTQLAGSLGVPIGTGSVGRNTDCGRCRHAGVCGWNENGTMQIRRAFLRTFLERQPD